MYYKYAIKILWLIWLGYWLINWQGNKKTAQHSNPRARLIALVILIAVGFALYAPDKGWLQTQIIPHNDAVLTLGVVLTALGLGFSIWARYTLGRNWSANPTIKEDHELITRGPYRWARHPIYTGLLLALLGAPALAGGQASDLLFFAFLTFMLWLKSRVEERLMLSQFPDAYPAYQRRVKAIIPFVL